MKENEILKGNKLIAEFMGAKYKKDTNIPMFNYNIWLPIFGLCRYDTIELGKGKTLHYHDSWDWLMPVVQKIIPPHGWQISGIEYQNYIINSLSGANIDRVWFSVVEFIKWYNQSK